MILVYLIGILLTGAFLAWITGRRNPALSRIISVTALSVDLLLTVSLIFLPNDFENKWLIDYKQD